MRGKFSCSSIDRTQGVKFVFILLLLRLLPRCIFQMRSTLSKVKDSDLKLRQNENSRNDNYSSRVELNICRDFHFRNFWCLGTRGSPKYSWSNNVARLFNFNGNLFNGKWGKTVRNHFWGKFSFCSQNMTRNWTFDKLNIFITSEVSFKEGSMRLISAANETKIISLSA